MNKSELFAAFNGCISKSAIIKTDGEPGTYKIVGKFAEIEPFDDGTFDVWFTDTSSLAASLGTRKLNNILSAAENHSHRAVTERVDGEAWLSLPPDEIVPFTVALAKVLGIRKTRQMSPEQKQAAANRLAEMRAA